MTHFLILYWSMRIFVMLDAIEGLEIFERIELLETVGNEAFNRLLQTDDAQLIGSSHSAGIPCRVELELRVVLLGERKRRLRSRAVHIRRSGKMCCPHASSCGALGKLELTGRRD